MFCFPCGVVYILHHGSFTAHSGDRKTGVCAKELSIYGAHNYTYQIDIFLQMHLQNSHPLPWQLVSLHYQAAWSAYHATVWHLASHVNHWQCDFILTCWSIKPIRGLMMIPIAELLTERGPRNKHNDLPAPVAIRTNTSEPCAAARVDASCPGLKLLCLKITFKEFSTAGIIGQRESSGHWDIAWDVRHAHCAPLLHMLCRSSMVVSASARKKARKHLNCPRAQHVTIRHLTVACMFSYKYIPEHGMQQAKVFSILHVDPMCSSCTLLRRPTQGPPYCPWSQKST